MSDRDKKIKAIREEGAKKFALLHAEGSAVRNFANAKRENWADNYKESDADELVLALAPSSVRQSARVYKAFASEQDS